jgi:hypothetical protein
MRQLNRFGVKRNKGKRLIRAVIDTNILISGLFTATGTIADLMELWIKGKFELVTSHKILDELYRVLHKRTIQKHFNPSEDEIEEYVEVIKEKAIITPDLYQTGRIKKDPTDNKLLACAMEAKADFIVSGDKHLKEIKQFHEIRIVDAKTFVEIVTKA